jgi:hypothetical protein
MKRSKKMKCISCGFEAPIGEFRYLYNPQIDESLSMRQCPKCHEWIGVDQLKKESVRTIKAGDAAWGKSAGLRLNAGC